MRRFSSVLVLFLVVFLTLSAGAFAKGLHIGVAIPSADHGWTGGVVYWAQKAIADWEAKNPDLRFSLVTANSAAEQVGQVEDLMVKGIDALVILAHESAALTPIVEEVRKEGIYVVSVDRGLTKDVQNVYIAGDNPGMGRNAAQWLAQKLNGKGKIVVLEGIPGVINSERVDAFNAVMADYPGIEILDSQPAYWSTQRGLEVMENYLQKYPEIDAVWTGDDDVLKGALQAYRESGRRDIKYFFGGAGSKDIVKMILDGDELVQANVTYPPSMIVSGISLAVYGASGEPLPGFYQQEIPARIILAAELITQENAEDYYFPDSVF